MMERVCCDHNYKIDTWLFVVGCNVKHNLVSLITSKDIDEVGQTKGASQSVLLGIVGSIHCCKKK